MNVPVANQMPQPRPQMPDRRRRPWAWWVLVLLVVAVAGLAGFSSAPWAAGLGTAAAVLSCLYPLLERRLTR